MHDLIDQIETRLNARPRVLTPLSGGCIGQVFRADMPDGSRLVVKAAGPDGTLDVEGFMLGYLATHSAIPVPRVFVAEPELLVMEFMPGRSRFSDEAQAHAAELLADLHSRTSGRYGFERATLIGGLTQPNNPCESWIEFFRDHRLLHMADAAVAEGQVSRPLHARIRSLASQLSRLLPEPARPALIHGDVWTTNILAATIDGRDRISAFLDPAIYYADPEIELAFITLFSTFGSPFFDRYHDLRPIRPGFFEIRRHIYNLYPLLVHARLFAASYAHSVSEALAHLGF